MTTKEVAKILLIRQKVLLYYILSVLIFISSSEETMLNFSSNKEETRSHRWISIDQAEFTLFPFWRNGVNSASTVLPLTLMLAFNIFATWSFNSVYSKTFHSIVVFPWLRGCVASPLWALDFFSPASAQTRVKPMKWDSSKLWMCTSISYSYYVLVLNIS